MMGRGSSSLISRFTAPNRYSSGERGGVGSGGFLTKLTKVTRCVIFVRKGAAHVNPFNPYFPAQEDLFANRRREQAVFLRGLQASTEPKSPGPWNIAVLGPWGIGKTSLLRRFASIGRKHFVPVGIVSLSVTSSFQDFDGLAALLLQRTKEELGGYGGWSEKIRKSLSNWEPTISFGPVAVSRKGNSASISGAGLLYSELRRLWERHAINRLGAVMFFLDDVQNLLLRDPGLLLTLRSVFQDLQGLGAVYPLVIAGPEDMFESARDLAEPVTRFFERIPLGPFSLDDAREAIVVPLRSANNPLEVQEDAVCWIWERTAGHPYFVSFVMREAVDLATDRGETILNSKMLEECWETIASRLSVEKFSVEWNSATSAEKIVLRAAAGGSSIGAATGKGGTALALRLVKKGLLLRRARGDYTPYHPLFSSYVQNVKDS